ncbi:MAG TPA: prephenate dehydrogenase/arogenate dehydrogenase family protein [Syntrophorhabdaceae bacterium]|nr:prephenate dehydrogenase/arogenate dehydrogenase family protein [Syntrophorhabdaceae bacterium]HPP42670.1 prephenate dehydrogenase/arogenate dehydrogenase family protein [Syntrophorhabdaceae bacterium]
MKIMVIGAGRMGSWFAKELAWANDVAVYDREPKRLQDIKAVKIFDEISYIKTFKPDLLINAVTLKDTILAFNACLPFIEKSCIISDIASIKGELKDFYNTCDFDFVSMHPMFGPTFANMGSLKNENVIFIKDSSREGVAFFKDFFSRYRLKFFEYTFEEHDEMMAYSLTLPFLCSMAFAGSVKKNVVPGTTFERHLKIAKKLLKEDDSLLGEILFNTHSMSKLDTITGRLEYLKHIIIAKDQEELSSFLKTLRENIR